MTKIYDVIVVGAGPGGVAMMVELAERGISNTLLLEKSSMFLSTIRDFYKDGKRVDKEWKGVSIEPRGVIDFLDGTKETTLEFFGNLIEKRELEVEYSKEVESIESWDNKFRIHTTSNELFIAEKVVVAIGSMGKPNKPDYKIPPKLKSVVNFNTDKCSTNENILVVGGGNSASEYAYALVDDGNSVTMSYRKHRFSRLNSENLHILKEYSEKKKLKLKMAIDIEKLSEADGKVRVHFSHGETEVYDRVIYAIGGAVPTDTLRKSKIELNENLRPILNENMETSVSGIFVIGDLGSVSGGSISLAIDNAYTVAEKIVK